MKKRFMFFWLVWGLLVVWGIGEVRASEEIVPPPYSDMRHKELSTIHLLATNAYHEGRGESDIANLAIMSVVYARTLLGGRYGNSYEEVIFKPYMFSWTNDGKSDRIRDKEQYGRLYLLAERFLIDKDMYLSIFERADHYHKVGIKTNWNYRKLDYIGRIDNHVFYRHK
ncbi:cell wall hydrolase [Vibrio phage 1.170.O._10N.261.52.C3]|nr:cell wall hydrolase [Vibrio phage 1.170.O._10N.261.52.C3]